MLTIRIILFLSGAALVISTLFSAIKTFVVPRGSPDFLTRTIFITVRRAFTILLLRARTYKAQDSIMAFFAPISLMALLPTWLLLVTLGYTAMFWALGAQDWLLAFRQAGSSVLTLGFESSNGLFVNFLIFSSAMIGLMLVALLIAYLPTIYNAYARRENLVNKLEVRAGSPPSAVQMLERFHRIHGLDRLTEQWVTWETWFSEIEESHTSLPALVFFRSPRADLSWVNASGAILDAASITLSSIAIPNDPNAALCIRAGYLALRNIADDFDIPYNPAPHFPDDPIQISQQDFNEVLRRLGSAGVPLKPDFEQSWRDFAGWRVNYDLVLIKLAQITMAPESPWTGERLDPKLYPKKIFKPDSSK